MQTLRDMWERNARRYPDHPAIICEGVTRTYAGLVDRGLKLGSALQKTGARRQSRIAMLAMNCPEWMDFYVACELAGYIATTVNFRLSAKEIEFILTDSSPDVLLFEAQYTDAVLSIKNSLKTVKTFVCIGGSLEWALEYEAFLMSGAKEGPCLRPMPTDFVRLIYTSGTTGRPKGAIKTQAAELRVAEKIATIMDMNGSSRLLLMMPMFHVGSQLEQIGQHWAGGTVILHRKFDTAHIIETIEQERVSIVHMAPTMLQNLLEEPSLEGADLTSLQTFCYAAAPMPVSVLQQAVERLGPIFCDMYGSTEIGPTTMLYKHLHKLDGDAQDMRCLASVGQSVPGTEIRIVDENGDDTAPGVPGEVWIKSNSMFSGYWNNTAATIEAINDGWYASGDVGVLDERDYLYLVDRKKDMIISGGENIYCREVEEMLMQHDDVLDVAVIGIPDSKWGQSVRAVVVRREGSAVTEEDLKEFSRRQIARYKAPKSVIFVDDLPRLPSGKVSKVRLRETYPK